MYTNQYQDVFFLYSMKKEITKIRFNIFDLNFILSFAGFAIFTTFAESVSSIAYRAVALGVALLCFVGSGIHYNKLPNKAKWLLWFIVLLHIKSYFFCIASTNYIFNFALVYMFGVVLVPFLAFVFSYRKINWDIVLPILAVLLILTIFQGIISAMSADTLERVELNSRQSTLAFGDNSSYLFVIGITILKSATKKSNNWGFVFTQFLAVVAVIISIYGIAKAGSRGPLMAAVMAGLFILLTLKTHKGITVVVIAIMIANFSGLTSKSLENFAPVLFSRMNSTMEEGDMSGRDILYKEAIEKILDNPLIGDNPIILLGNGEEFTSYHNGYLDIGVGLGIIGFALYVYLNIWIILKLFSYRHQLFRHKQIFLSTMFFLSATRAMSGASLLSNTNYAISLLSAIMIIYELERKQQIKRLILKKRKTRRI